MRSSPAATGLVFIGPSILRSERPQLPGVRYVPPVQRGDLGTIADSGVLPSAVGLVDGVFDQTLAVAPREVLALLRRGVKVYGASSMGALRAAELCTVGMTGIGRVFELYRDDVVMSEDEVAIMFDEESERCLTEPLVNVRCSVEHLVAAGTLDPALGKRIVAVAQALPYRDRTYSWIAQVMSREAGVNIAPFVPLLRAHDQKKVDALALIRRLAQEL